MDSDFSIPQYFESLRNRGYDTYRALRIIVLIMVLSSVILSAEELELIVRNAM